VSVRVIFRPEAETEAYEAFDWYESNRQGVGVEFRSALQLTIQRIAEHPTSYAPEHRQLRHALVRRFPYGVYFRIVGDVVVVVGIIHLKRHPGVAKTR
jgi:plasmid stabilization system protein ParE